MSVDKVKEYFRKYGVENNRGQSSKLLRELADKDQTAYILKNGKPIAVVFSNERYERLHKAATILMFLT